MVLTAISSVPNNKMIAKMGQFAKKVSLYWREITGTGIY